MFGLSLIFKSYCATMSFMVFVLILSPQTLVKSTEEKEPSEYHCISVQASDYFCSPSNQTGNSQNCFGALLAIYPMVLSILCLFAFSAHLWFTFKSQMPNFCDWILSGFFMLAWLAAFAIMIYVCVANKLESYPVPTTWIVATTLCFILVLILVGEAIIMLRKPEYYYGLMAISKTGAMAVAEPTAPLASPTSMESPYPSPYQPLPPAFV